MRTLMALLCVSILGCGGKDGGNPNTDASKSPDAKRFLDAPPTNNATVTISGQASERSTGAAVLLPGVTIEAFRNADETTPIATTTTDAQGNYTFTIQTMGESIDGFLRATKQGYLVTYLYPPYPIAMDFNMATVIMITPNTRDSLNTIAQGMQQPGKGLVGLVVTDGTNPVEGATVSTSDPTAVPIRYNAMSGTLVFPSSQATATYTDGVAYVFNAPTDQMTVSAMKTGSTFSTHALKAWADQLTTTVIVP